MSRARRTAERESTQEILRHWREAVPNDRLAHLVRDAARALVRSLQMRLTEHSVSFGHWAFLRILWERDGITQAELSAQAGVMAPTTFAALQAMEKLGYVMRRRAPGSRKRVQIFLTPRGRLLKSKLVPLAEEVNRVAVHGVPPRDLAVVRRTLLAIIENLADDERIMADRERGLVSTRELARVVHDAARRRRPRPRKRA